MTKFLLVKIWSVGVSLLLAVGTARNGEFKYFEMCCQLGMEAGGWARGWRLSISAPRSSIRRFVITEKAPTRAFSWLKAATTAFTGLLRDYEPSDGPF